MRKTIGILFVLLVFGSVVFDCKKTEFPEPTPVKLTIKPAPYFPAYPGSWWKYKITDSTSTEIVTYSVSATYQSCIYCTSCESGSCKSFSDEVFVPYVSLGKILRGGPIIGYSQLPSIAFYYSCARIPVQFVSDKAGPCNIRPEYTVWDWRNGCPVCYEEVYKWIDKKKVGNDSVLQIKGVYLNGATISNGNTCASYTEFVKNTGIRLKIKYDTISHDTLFRAELLDYYINH